MIIQDKKFLIYGVGKTGISLAKFIIKNGGRVAVFDGKVSELPSEIASMGVENRCSQKKKEVLSGIDVMILSPGISIYDEIVKHAIMLKLAVYSEMDFSLCYLLGVKIGITASCGKSTTTKLIYELLKMEYSDVRIGGNYGVPICDLCENSTPKTISVIEVSSFMLEQSKFFHFDVGVFSNVSKNHLDRHKTMKKYISAKCKISKNMTSLDTLILPLGESKIKAGILKNINHLPRPKIVYFEKVIKHNAENLQMSNAERYANRVDGSWLYVDDKQIAITEEFLTLGKHNAENLLVATMVAKHFSISDKSIQTAVGKFKPLPHRFEKITTKNGVTYINDSKSTSAKSAETSLLLVDFPAVLMMGGSDKSDDFFALFEKIKKNPFVVKVILYGEVSFKLSSHARSAGFFNYEKCSNFKSAFNLAKSMCTQGGSLILMPACPSYDEFKNFEYRGDLFRALVGEIDNV